MHASNITFKASILSFALLGAYMAPSFAQVTTATPATEVQRNVNQQQRIESGLQSGQLNTKEAARLEKGEAHIDKMESKALKDGTVSDAEKARINAAQNAESKAIASEKHDAQTGNPNSASSKRMQADVQRNVNQQTRIENGVKSGALTTGETAALERGQARVSRKEARAGADGHVGKGEEASIQASENRQSRRIHNKKHDAV